MTFDSLRSGQQMSALEFFLQDKPLPSLPSLPSPTLTNPDMVLPYEGNVPALPSPTGSMGRPPSPSYLTDRTNDLQNARTPAPKKEKRGLMSRKMLLLRSRTGSGMAVNGNQHQQLTPRSVPSESDANSVHTSAYASSSTLMDVGNLAPEQVNEKRLSFGGSSFNSEEFAAIPSFLAKYEATDRTTTDDELFDGDSPAPQKYGYSVSIEGGADAQRRQQEEDEHNSAILSKRAEQILANAKKRLHLMEGNLRGARDLVAPLTAANLKRATSLGSAHHSTYASRSRLLHDGYVAEPARLQQPVRTLHAQASSPTMGRDFAGHAHGFSETELPERPQTAFSKSNSGMRSGRIPVKASEGSWTQSLRSSRSYDSLVSNTHHVVRERPLHARGSPDSNLGPLPEDEASHRATLPRNNTTENDRHDALGIYRPASKADDLREQMTSLKGKISTLKERAREDSLGRQSLQNLRTPSPLNNAVASPPEFFYTQSQSCGSPILDTNAGKGQISQDNSPATPQSPQKTWDTNNALTGRRNAFAQQAAAQRNRQDGPISPRRTAQTKVPRKLSSELAVPQQNQHRRTQSGTAIVQPASSGYAHHQYTPSREMPGTYIQNEVEEQVTSGASSDEGISPLPAGEPLTPDYEYVVSDQEDVSVYQDAEDESPPVVAHEDRDDAFDYEHFFLHSAMGTYGGRRGSSSSAESVSSVETARGSATVAQDQEFDPGSGIFPPPTPDTPERLKEIERNLHRRTLSTESVSTVATFATADQGPTSAENGSWQPNTMDWPIPPSESVSNPGSRPNSRPSTAIKRPQRRRDSSSERADSGVGLSRRSNSEYNKQRSGSTFASPPISPRTMPHDPAIVVVNALLDPHERQLGLKDKAILFGLVENLRKVVARLQDVDEGQYEGRVLRRRLDDAKRALDGSAEQRPGTS